MPLGQEKPPVRAFNLIKKDVENVSWRKNNRHRISFVMHFFFFPLAHLHPHQASCVRVHPECCGPESIFTRGGRLFRCKDLGLGFFIWSVKTWPYWRKLLRRLEVSLAKISAASGRSQTWSCSSMYPKEAPAVGKRSACAVCAFMQRSLEITLLLFLHPQDVVVTC